MSKKNISLHKQFLHTFWDSILVAFLYSKLNAIFLRTHFLPHSRRRAVRSNFAPISLTTISTKSNLQVSKIKVSSSKTGAHNRFHP